MKLEVNQKGLRQDGKLVPVGTVLEIDGKTVPASMVGKVGIINPAGKVDNDGPADPTTAAEALALFTTEGVHVNTAKAKAKAFLGNKVKDDASKDDIVKALEELATQP